MFYILGNRVQHTLAALGKQEENKTFKLRKRTTAGKAPFWLGTFRASVVEPTSEG